MKTIKTFFKQNNIPLEAKFLVAVSAGPDSTALLDMMRKLVENPSKQLTVAHVDHQLRNDSFLESKVLKNYCQKYNLQLQEMKWAKKDHPLQGIEASARKVRYDFFYQIMQAEDIPYLLTAHHGDDLTENILLKLIRSGNVQEMNSLKEMGKFKNRIILRPLLSFSKAELLEYVKDKKLKYIEDQTNFEDDTLRNRLRHKVVPLLKKENPHLIQKALNFQRSENDLQSSQDTLFSAINAPIIKLGSLTGKLADLKNLSVDQQKLFFEWLIFKNWHRRLHFKNWKASLQKISRDGFNLLFYQGQYYLFKNGLLEVQPKPIKKIKLDQGFIFAEKEYIISLTKKKLDLIGSFYGPPDLELRAGSIPAGAKLELANGKMSKAKKKFAENAIPNELRKLCLTVIGKSNKQTKIYFVQDCYQNQIFDSKYQKYYIYRNSEEKFK